MISESDIFYQKDQIEINSHENGKQRRLMILNFIINNTIKTM